MRQVFSSARLENVERVADMLREAGIEVRITDGRSYKGARRTTVSYRDTGDTARPAVWIVHSEDATRAREILREAGLIDSTRPGAAKLTVRSEFGDDAARTPAQKRATRIKVALLIGIVIVIAFEFMHAARKPAVAPVAAVAPKAPVAQPATGPFDGRVAATPAALAQAVLQKEIAGVDTPVACIAVDGRDPPAAVLAAVRAPAGVVPVPASQCQRIADEDRGSVHRATGRKATMIDVEHFRPSSPDAGTIEYNAYHHRMWAKYKTLDVRRSGGQWQVARTVKVVAP
ncbi:DUF2007 domain-containing protein [Cognatilysobacter segetis]|uniref:DUF2007 domain-containing protein n=1 Tax=Cognatilysobacter segetis TaxID=2492394 RepID=UPI00105F375F|nr:DUF2007 domain-containing protein [Lysobacter segetis]